MGFTKMRALRTKDKSLLMSSNNMIYLVPDDAQIVDRGKNLEMPGYPRWVITSGPFSVGVGDLDGVTLTSVEDGKAIFTSCQVDLLFSMAINKVCVDNGKVTVETK